MITTKKITGYHVSIPISKIIISFIIIYISSWIIKSIDDQLAHIRFYTLVWRAIMNIDIARLSKQTIRPVLQGYGPRKSVK